MIMSSADLFSLCNVLFSNHLMVAINLFVWDVRGVASCVGQRHSGNNCNNKSQYYLV